MFAKNCRNFKTFKQKKMFEQNRFCIIPFIFCYLGYMSDPNDLPGLAHLCEHMLFMGTEKYPNINDYISYLTSHGGSSNANTYSDHTIFYFDVDRHYLENTLDRFAQFFVSPLFLESTFNKELNSINHEHEKNLKEEDWRLVQFDKYTADPGHPYSKFGTGNIETLDTIPRENNVDVREELLKFWETHYSANVMSLSILGKGQFSQPLSPRNFCNDVFYILNSLISFKNLWTNWRKWL